MPEHTVVFYLVFLSQILLISFYFPRKVLIRMKHVVDTYPPAQYPKLYPVSMDATKRARRVYGGMNLFALLVGLTLVLFAFFSPREEMLNWDSDMVLTIYLFVQFSPLIIATTSGFTYFNLMRRDDLRSTRKAELRPRRLFDFVSPRVVGAAIFVYIVFILLVFYVRQYEFSWFGGYWNIFGITVLNLFLAGIVTHNVYGRRKDPYQAYDDRTRQMGLMVKIMFFVSIVATMFMALTIILAAFELRPLQPIALSLYCQVLAAASFRAFRIDHVDFEVYRADPLPT